MNEPKITISVGIATYEAGESLVVTLNSIYKQTYFPYINEVLVAVDGKKISKIILDQIQNSKLRLLEFPERLGQASRLNNIFENSSTDFIILTNDDVILEPNAIENLTVSFVKNNSDLITGQAIPIKPKNQLQRILRIGYLINAKLINYWNNSDNYLSCNGRFVGLSRNYAKKMKIPGTLWNTDAFLYINAKIHGMRVKHESAAICLYQDPENLNEYMNQTAKFQMSLNENRVLFKENLLGYYRIPFLLKLKSFFAVFLSHPIYAPAYGLLYIYSRLFPQKLIKNTGFWETDPTTKKLRIPDEE